MSPEASISKESGNTGMSRRGFLKAGGLLVAGGLLAEGGRRLAGVFGGSGMHSREDAQRHVSESRKVWLPADQVEEAGCPDGRTDQCIVGTFGGTTGDFALEVGALQEASGRRFDKRQVHGMFDRNLQRTEKTRFFLHTDDHAMHHLAHDMHVTEREMYEIIRDPNGHRAQLIELLKDPKNMGCGHAARLKGHWQDYPGITPEIMDGTLERFFDEVWSHNPRMDYAVLHGEHAEQSVLRVSTDAPFNERTLVPMIQPSFVRSDGMRSSAYVIHPQVEELSERQWTENALEISGLMDVNLARYRQLMREYRRAHMLRTARDLVTTQPTFDAKYDPATLKIEVKESA